MKYTSFLIILFVLLGFTACGGSQQEQTLPEGVELATDTDLLKFIDCDGYMYVEVRASEADSIPLAKYVIIEPGANPEKIPQGCTVIKAPLQRSIVTSSVHTSGIDELGMIDAIAGVTDAVYFVADDPVTERLKNGSIANVGESFAPDIEKIIDLNPDAIMLSPHEGQGYDDLKKLNVPLIYMTDYLESTPLRRAEWILFLGALYGRFDEASEIFSEVNEKYQRMRVAANKKSLEVPLVITEKPMSGVWYVPGGKSYMTAIIQDAGATTPWAETTESGSIPKDVSAVIDEGSQATFWLIKDAKEITKESLLAEVPHAKAFKAFPNNVYVCNTLDTRYYNTVAFHPEKVLAELIEIFYDGKLSNDSTKLSFYHQIR